MTEFDRSWPDTTKTDGKSANTIQVKNEKEWPDVIKHDQK